MASGERALRVMMLGLRGFPNVQGGVERHAERLCPLLAEMGCKVEVVVRARYVPRRQEPYWRGVRRLRLWSPKSRTLEAIVHSLLGVLVAAWRRPDILHVQAIGPALVVPIARLFGLRVVVTHHGADYEREKWGTFARRILRLGERWGMRFSHRRIVISRTIARSVRRKYRLGCHVIPNGIVLPDAPGTASALQVFDLTRGNYVLTVSRLVPEKRHFDLIAAFRAAKLCGWKLVLVGGGDRDPYSQLVADVASRTSDIVMAGVQTGTALQELFAHAGLFVLPSSHEGLPIAIIEALGYGLPVIASDIPAHLELGLDESHYFPLGDVIALTQRIYAFAAAPWSQEARRRTREWLAQRDDWQAVAEWTLRSYRKAMDPRRSAWRWAVAQRALRPAIDA